MTTTVDEHEVLKQQHNALRDLLDKSHAEGLRYKQRLEQLAHALQERDRRIAELQLFEHRLKKTNDKTQDLETQLAKAKESNQAILEEKGILESNLTDSQQHIKQLERVIQFLRERAETSRLELRQVQSELMANQESTLNNIQQIEEKTAEVDVLRYEVQFEKSKHEETVSELGVIQQQWAHLQQCVRNAQQQASRATVLANSLRSEKQLLETALLAKEDVFNRYEQQLRAINNELNLLKTRYNTSVDGNVSAAIKLLKLQEELRLQDAEIEELYRRREANQQEIATLRQYHQQYETHKAESEVEIRMAQQHLAKRVKEATLLSEKNEILRQQISELQKEAMHHQNKANDLQQSLEQQIQNEKMLQEQFSQTVTSTEARIGHWEAKYLQIFEKWKETETRNLELAAIEEKQMQLQALLSNFTMLAGSASNKIPVPTTCDERPQLFETPKPTIRFKQSLFD